MAVVTELYLVLNLRHQHSICGIWVPVMDQLELPVSRQFGVERLPIDAGSSNLVGR